MTDHEAFRIMLVEDSCILVAVRDFSGGVAQADDETLMIVKVGSER